MKESTYFNYYKYHRKESVRGLSQFGPSREPNGATDWENSNFFYFKYYLGIYILSLKHLVLLESGLELGLQSFVVCCLLRLKR